MKRLMLSKGLGFSVERNGYFAFKILQTFLDTIEQM